MDSENRFTVYLRGNNPQEYLTEKVKSDLESQGYTVVYSDSYHPSSIKDANSLVYVLSDMSSGLCEMMEIMYVLPQSILVSDASSYKKTIFVVRPDEDSQNVFMASQIEERKKPVKEFADTSVSKINNELLKKTEEITKSVSELQNFVKTLVEKKDSQLKNTVAKIANEFGHIHVQSESDDTKMVFSHIKGASVYSETDFYSHLDADKELDVETDDVFQKASRLLIRASFYIGSQNVRGVQTIFEKLNGMLEDIKQLQGIARSDIDTAYNFIDTLLKDSNYTSIQNDSDFEKVSNRNYEELLSKKKSYENLVRQLNETNFNADKYESLRKKYENLNTKKKEVENLESQRSNYESKKKQYNENIERYTRNIANINKQIENLRENMNKTQQKKSEYNSLKSEINRKKLELEENKSKLNSTKEKLDELRNQLGQVESEYASLQKEIEEKNKTFQNNQSKISGLEYVPDELRQNEDALKSLEEKRTELNKNKEKREGDMTLTSNNVLSRYESLKREVDTLQSELSESEGEFRILENKKKKINEIQRQINDLQWNGDNYDKKVKNYQTYKKAYRFENAGTGTSELSDLS